MVAEELDILIFIARVVIVEAKVIAKSLSVIILMVDKRALNGELMLMKSEHGVVL